jgi:regulator of protease activity HflC (stomatin/prohibitin superfamily)
MLLDRFLVFATIIAWIVFLAMVLILIVRGLQDGGLRGMLRSLASMRLFVLLVVALFISLLSSSLVFVEPNKVAVVVSLFDRNGYRDQPIRSGLHWIWPLAEEVESYTISWQTYTMSSEPLEGIKIGDDSIAARTSDGQAVYLDSSVIFRIDPSKVIQLHIDFQNRYIDDYIRPILRGIIRTEVSQFTADEVNSSKRKDLEASLDENLRSILAEKGMILDRFLLRNIAFSSQYASAIEQKQVAEQQRIMREYEAEQIRTIAQANADAAVLEGEGQAKVIQLKAEAEAQALRLLSGEIEANPDLLLYRYIDKLSPGIKALVVPGNNPLFLSLPDLGLTEIPTPEPASMATPRVLPDTTSAQTPTAIPTQTPTPAP